MRHVTLAASVVLLAAGYVSVAGQQKATTGLPSVTVYKSPT